jgi:uncharacterized protein
MLYSHYQHTEDRDSAYELLKQKTAQAAEATATAKAEADAAKHTEKAAAQAQKQAEKAAEREQVAQAKAQERAEERATRAQEKMLMDLAGTAGKAFAGSMGKSIARGVLGSILGRG